MSEEPKYPWLRLLELEVSDTKPDKKKKKGRPKNPFPRKRVRSSLTDDEKAALDDLVDMLAERFEKQVHRGHLISFMTFRLRSRLQGQGREIDLPEDIKSFVDLAAHLDSLK
jgi:hypothetical protein